MLSFSKSICSKQLKIKNESSKVRYQPAFRLHDVRFMNYPTLSCSFKPFLYRASKLLCLFEQKRQLITRFQNMLPPKKGKSRKADKNLRRQDHILYHTLTLEVIQCMTFEFIKLISSYIWRRSISWTFLNLWWRRCSRWD